MTAALIIVDVQKAMDDPRYGVRGQLDAESNIARLLAHWREAGGPIIHIRDNAADPASPYAPGKPSYAFKDEVKPLEDELIIDKHSSNPFVDTTLLSRLQALAVKQLVVCGAHLQHCVESTVRAAAALGFEVTVPSDCVVATDARDIDGRRWSADDIHAITLGVLNGNHATVLTSAQLMQRVDA